MIKHLTLIAATFLLALPAAAMKPSQIMIANPYAYATTSVQKNGAVFFDITNLGTSNKVIKANGDVAERVELHTHTMDEGVMMMREVEGYDLPAEETVTLEPTGHHIMLMNLNAPLKKGESFPLTITFENHAPITVDVEIVAPGTKPQ